MVNFVPVDHDPFSQPKLIPVDHDPFSPQEQYGPPSDLQNTQKPMTIGRAAGLTAKAVGQGLSAPANFVRDVPIMAANKILGSNIKTFSNIDERMATKAGLPVAQNPSERVYSDVVSGAANPLNLIGGPVMGTLSGAMAGGAGGLARESGAGPWGQFVASLLGGLSPSAVAQGLPAATRGLLRGGQESAANMRNTIQTFEDVGTTPTLGQATQRAPNQWLESTLSKAPGGNPILSKAESQAQEIGAGLEGMANKLSKNATAEQAGRAIKSGIVENFIPNSRKVQKRLYDDLDKFIPQGQSVGATNLKNTVDRMTAPIPGAKAISNTKLLSNGSVDEIKQAMVSDMGGAPPSPSRIMDEFGIPYSKPGVPSTEKLPYEALKEIRTRIGEKLSNVDLAPDISRAELKQLYGAITEDMKVAAKTAGPKAEAAFKRANQYTKAFHDRVDLLQGVIDKNGGPEKIFKAAVSGTAEGATTFRSVMKSLPMDGKKTVTAAILRRIGKATAGNQNDVGDVFSANTFLTNWNKLSPEAKQTMTGPLGKQFSSDLDKVAKVADNLKSGSKVYANPSGTAQAASNITSLGAFMFALFTGHFVGAGALGSAVGATNLSARALTNPNFVKWLSRNGQKPVSAIPGALNALERTAKSENDRDTLDILDDLKNAQQGK